MAAAKTRTFPLSFSQQRLWVLDRLAPGTPIYNIPTALELIGSPDLSALARSFGAILERHSSLRTVFGEEDGTPYQRIEPPGPFPLPVADLTGLPEERREAEAERLVVALALGPFDLSTGPLIRALVVRPGQDAASSGEDGIDGDGADQRHILAVSMHHIVADGWSAGVFTRELMALYEAFLAGAPSPLPELPIQYVDFAVWQRDLLQGEVLEEEIDHWRRTLEGLPPMLALPIDRPRPPVQGFAGATREFEVPAELTEKLRRFVGDQGSTLFTTLMACFKALLHRLSGQADLPVGAPFANRWKVELEGLIGFFVNTLVLRGDLSGSPSFTELVAREKDVLVNAYDHRELPFERLVEELQPERNLSHTPLFQVMFSVQDHALDTVRLSGLTLRPYEFENPTAKFDLTMVVFERGDRLTGVLEYRTELFDPTTIERILGQFFRLAEALVDHPETPIDQLAFLLPGEEAQVLREWNDTAAADPEEDAAHRVHGLFEDWARRTPEAVAAVFEDQAITYGELDRRANQLARYLRGRGVGPDVPVALYLERGLDMMVSLLGILKAGGAYLGLDLQSPPERVRYTLEDSGTALVLTSADHEATVDALGAESFAVDVDWDEVSGLDDGPLEPATLPEHMLSLVYTSGSTGLPKGTATTHRGYANLIRWYNEFSRHSPATRSLLATGLNYDASFRSIFSALAAGGRTVLAPNGPYDPVGLLGTIRDQGVTVITCPPSLIHGVIDRAREEDDYRSLRSLEWLHLGGEALVNAKLRGWLASPHCRVTVTNVYGLTEVSDVSVTMPYAAEDLAEGESAPIGRPLRNHTVRILDPDGRLQPIGVPGEITLGGVGVTRGFLGKPAMTAERFVPDPWGDGERLYKTRDLGSWLADGLIAYSGRVDHQVKLRGLRIELGEIEEQLRQHPEVREAVAEVRETEAGDRRLVAWVLVHDPEALSSKDLRAFLKVRVPSFFIPSAFMIVGDLELNTSGKIDRQNLPSPVWGQGGEEADPGEAVELTETEATLVGFCTDLLEADRIGLDDNFFEMGGHSLLAMQLISRIREHFAVELTLQQLFQTPTVGQMAGVISERQAGGGALGKSSIPRLGRGQQARRSVLVSFRGGRAAGAGEPPVVFVHPSDGAIEEYRPLADALPEGRAGQALSAPDPEQLPFSHLGEAVATYLEILGEDGPGPRVLVAAGSAVPLAAALAEASALLPGGVEVERLVLVDPLLPAGARGGGSEAGEPGPTALEPLDLLVTFGREIERRSGKAAQVPREELEALGEEEWIPYLLFKWRIAKALPPGVDAEALERRFAIHRHWSGLLSGATAGASPGAEAPSAPGAPRWRGPVTVVTRDRAATEALLEGSPIRQASSDLQIVEMPADTPTRDLAEAIAHAAVAATAAAQASD